MAPCLLQGPPTTARYVRFGSFQIDRQQQRVVRDGNRLRLQGKTFAVLILLLQKRGEVTTREELKRALWSTETHVNYDANLNTTVTKLRRELGESTDRVPYIETIRRMGYRFTGAVEFSDSPFAEIRPANSAILETIEADRVQEARRHEFFLLSKSLTEIIVALVLVGILLGATAARLWITYAASKVRHSNLRESPCVSVRSTC